MRKEILEEAIKIVCGDRDDQYGPPESSLSVIAELWEPYIRAKCVGAGASVCVASEDVAMMMALLKIARVATGQVKRDNFVDLAGYAACGAEVALNGRENLDGCDDEPDYRGKCAVPYDC